MECALRNSVTECLRKILWLPEMPHIKKIKERERANKLEIYYEYRLVDSGRKEKVEVGVSPKNNEDKIRQHEPN